MLNPDSAMAYLDDWQARIDRTAAAAQAMSDRLAELRVTAADADGLVEVTIDSTGVLTDVRFGDRIQRVAPAAVSRAVLSALRDARRAAAARTRQIISETVGDDSVAGHTIADRMEQQLRGADD